jgi:hypothetical protein
MTMNLRDLQSLLYRRITDPDTTVEGCDDEDRPVSGEVEALINGDRRLSAKERLGIYANAFFFRLLDCIGEHFPVTLTVVGADDFAAIVRGYLRACPPTEPSILYAGYYLPEFLSDHPCTERWPFIADLAGLERAVLGVFHAADEPAPSVEEVRAVPLEEWPAMRFRIHPAVEIVPVEWRVAETLRAIEQGQEWEVPPHENASVLVWRQNALVRYRDLEPPERDALAVVSRGGSFAGICGAVAAATEEPDPMAVIGRLLARWLADEILASVDKMPATTFRNSACPSEARK